METFTVHSPIKVYGTLLSKIYTLTIIFFKKKELFVDIDI